MRRVGYFLKMVNCWVRRKYDSWYRIGFYTNKIGVRGYVTNVYTAPQHRGKGLAKMLLKKLIENAENRGIKKLWLGASKLGRPLYEKLGFIQQESYMELTLKDKSEV